MANGWVATRPRAHELERAGAAESVPWPSNRDNFGIAINGPDAVRALQAGPQGAGSLALVGTLADTHIVDTLRRFARRAPEVRLELRTASSAEVTDPVRRGNARPALFPERPAGPRRARRRQRSSTGRPAPPARPDLAAERWIGFPPSPGDRDSSGHLLARQLARAGLDRADLTLIDSLTAQKRLAEAGFGVALVPQSVCATSCGSACW